MKVMIPAIIIVKLLDLVGATELLAYLISPAMSLVGLPQEMGIVWAVALLTNIYTAMVVFYSIAATSTVSVADISVLGVMILIAHALPVEGAIAKSLGITWRATLLVRIGGALLLGAILNVIYSNMHWNQEPIVLVWVPTTNSTVGWFQWIIEQVQLFASIFVILASLIITLRLLRLLGIEALLHKLLMPLLKGLTLGKEAANITIIGMTLGLSFGAGLLIDEVKKGHISKRDTALVIGFLGLCHSIIEDTLLILLLGADIYAILWGRLLFAICIIAIWGRIYKQAR
ncbi:hypothetical protein [Vibrio algarum]|uniref:Nucleoside recognition protein n=1 Tax=Vibrio algarum TaxID=3020714 RepID=A0ABT4YMG3_9VIBR|nr:hypothetical protein [Vibrio sp. KJ40-1]MDB1122688.1 hypothetical protein [Vibrio sp. KJ40-1]